MFRSVYYDVWAVSTTDESIVSRRMFRNGVIEPDICYNERC